MATVTEPSPAETKSASGISAAALVRVLLVGVYFGIVLAKSEVARWERVHKMFLFQEALMYQIISVGIVVAAIAMFIIKRIGAKDVTGKPIVYKPKPYHKGVVIGGMLFGAGWAITGACPGPIYVQIGAGEWLGLVTLLGALIGMFAYAALKPKLPH
ncbi:MAG: YeeE/YedE family protein [Planctomycetales bacterium]|nr:YeeE/YedE family protein [Planctomycetales bacterium]